MLMGAPLTLACQALANGSNPQGGVIKVSMKAPTDCGGGDMYIVGKKDSVVVIFSVDFQDETDKAICKVLLQEFVEAQRSVNSAPSCDYKRGSEPPMELSDIPGIENTPDIAGFISFKLFKDHVKTPEKLKNSVSALVGFNVYQTYHLKATKTYMHMRMRHKSAELLKVLNRAVQTGEEKKEKKTFSGKTFTRS